jgi:hypothetical protein
MEDFELLDEYAVRESSVQILAIQKKLKNFITLIHPEYSLAPDQYFVLSKTREIVATYKPGELH